MRERARRRLARVLAPAAFLLAATVAVLLVRAALDQEPAAQRPAATTSTAAERPAARTRPKTSASAPRFVRVRRGDTLEAIAARAGTTVEALLGLNPTVDPVSLRVGQRLRVR